MLHTSDWHLGQKFIHFDREEEHKLALDWLHRTIMAEGVELLIISGDVFDTFNPPNTAQEIYYSFLTRLRETTCHRVVIVGGNHDSPSLLEAPRHLLRVLNIHVFGARPAVAEEAIISIQGADGQAVCVIAAIPFLRDSDLIASVSGESGLERVERIRQGILNHFHEMAESVSPFRKRKIPAIATGHLYAKGAHTSEKQENIYTGDIANLDASIIAQLFDYVALGHIHRSQAVSGFGHIRYSGSLIPLSFSESADGKSVTVFDCGKGGISNIRELGIPVFRRLKTIHGTLVEVKQRLADFAGRHNHELKPWVEIILEDDTVTPGVDQHLREFARDFWLEILKIRILRLEQKLNAQTATVELEDLDVLEVFQKKCERDGVPEKEIPALIDSFRELIASVTHQ
jgi:exonuclease SbcD